MDQLGPLSRDNSDAAALLDIFASEIGVISFFGERHLGRLSVGIHGRQIAFGMGHFAAGAGIGCGQAHCIGVEMDLSRKANF